MYFSEFDSYIKFKDQNTYQIQITLVGGGEIVSSMIPREAFNEVLEDILSIDDTSGVLTIWNGKSNALTMVPRESIKQIKVV